MDGEIQINIYNKRGRDDDGADVAAVGGVINSPVNSPAMRGSETADASTKHRHVQLDALQPRCPDTGLWLRRLRSQARRSPMTLSHAIMYQLMRE